ncbi:hypothetical protein Micbo1qcDRAFT_205672 [Microdochium bolleyi]|uniref:DUF3669 domain-containing protein n=1 Tax=Microdochium bolleyi TaxID=196109 RepID=A0A136IZ28_9PEZI|nr:hypothetical protein Micbo1qcDRAFT_205672 [Microdochium bolleyi]
MAAPQDQPLLLQLPPEIRLNIYDLFMRDHVRDVAARAESHPESIISPESSWPLHTLERADCATPLRWICRQVRDETSQLAYGYLHFTVRHWQMANPPYFTQDLGKPGSRPHDQPFAPVHLQLEWRLPVWPWAIDEGQYLNTVREAFAWHCKRRTGRDPESTDLMLSTVRTIRFILVQPATTKPPYRLDSGATTMEHLYKKVAQELDLVLLECRRHGQLKKIELEGLFPRQWVRGLEQTFGADGSIVLKLAKTTDASLFNDFQKHNLIYHHIAAHNIDVKVPVCHSYIRAEDSHDLFDNTPELVEAARAYANTPTRVLVSQRINPLPETTRAHLINKYCRPQLRDAAHASPKNKDCLVRPQLGSMRGRSTMTFSLRNFKLHLNQAIDLQLDVLSVASTLAKSLAVMHWAALTDARDVEFVLGSSAPHPAPRPTWSEIVALTEEVTIGASSGTFEEQGFFCHQTTELWLLDFNQVRDIDLDDEGLVDKLVDAHNCNDPYYPKPCQAHTAAEKVWDKFATAYLEMAAVALHDKTAEAKSLPGRFLDALVAHERAKQNVVA